MPSDQILNDETKSTALLDLKCKKFNFLLALFPLFVSLAALILVWNLYLDRSDVFSDVFSLVKSYNCTLPNNIPEDDSFVEIKTQGANSSLSTIIPEEILQKERAKVKKEQMDHSNLNYQINMAARLSLKPMGKCEREVKCEARFQMWALTPTWPCPNEVHVGSWGEGGKWLCNVTGAIPSNNGLVYSVGSNGDYGFEKAMYDRLKLRSHTFDPTLNETKMTKITSLPYVDFHNIGISGSDNPDDDVKKFPKGILAAGFKMMHLEDIMEMLGHKYVDVFKIDCEGCEFAFVDHLMKVGSREKPFFGQMQVEIHNHYQEKLESFTLSLEMLGYRLFHVELNFYSPGSWEIAYIHESLTTG